MQQIPPDERLHALRARGLVWIRESFSRVQEAWAAAEELVDAAAEDEGPLAVVGDFVLPPDDGPPSRDFQTLHVDFGLPLTPMTPADVARFTALHVRADAPAGDAITRLVPLGPLLDAAAWPGRDELVRRFARYGDSHGAWDPTAGYVEGSLARIVEAALGETPVLPSVTAQPGFLCGTEFAGLDDELRFFRQRGLDPASVEIEVGLRPGELLIFDNLALAHGRRGSRRPGELNQRCFGHRALSVERQVELRDRVLAAFSAGRVQTPSASLPWATRPK